MWGVKFPEPYMQLYNASAVALKTVSPRLRVGGPATMQTLDVDGFIQACRTSNIPVDFVSTHFVRSQATNSPNAGIVTCHVAASSCCCARSRCQASGGMIEPLLSAVPH